MSSQDVRSMGFIISLGISIVVKDPNALFWQSAIRARSSFWDSRNEDPQLVTFPHRQRV